MVKKHTARCACDAVQFEFDADPDFIAMCHCLDCKKASGGEAAVFFGIPANDFSVTRGEVRAFHYIADSGGHLDRNVCKACGARLFTNNLDTFPGAVFVQLGAMDDPQGFAPKLEMFTKRRLPWVKALDLPQFEAMPG